MTTGFTTFTIAKMLARWIFCRIIQKESSQFPPIVCCVKYNNNKLLFSYELKTTILMKDIESIKYLYKEEVDKGSNTERIDT